jgi:CubicO group peptidase (beta-lactamase class C family)
MMRFAALLLSLLITVPGAGVAQARGAGRDPLAGLDAYIQDAMAKGNGVGLAIAVVKNDSIVYARGFGVRRLGEPAPVTPRTVFAVGSTTKAFTAAALGMLVDQGQLAWDDRVTRHLPEFELFDPAVTREITVRDLITHRSGLSRGDRLWMGSRYSRPEVIRRVRYHSPTWSLRTTFGYQNIMYLAGGEIIPAVTGVSWDDFLRDRIFQPLGMTSTSTTVRGLDRQPDVAQPHDRRDGKVVPVPYRNIDNIGPAGSINSNVLDMAQWIRLHLNGGKAGGRQLISPAIMRELHSPQMWLSPAAGELAMLYPGVNFLGYGLGWFLFDHAGRKVVEHSGGIDGMITELMMVPSEQLGVVVLSNNGASILAFPVARAVVNRYLGVAADPLPPSLAMAATLEEQGKKLEDSLERARARGRGPSLPLEAYAGVYDDPMYGAARVAVESGKLVLQGDGLAAELPLEHWHYDVFRGEWGDAALGKAFVTFRLAADGSVAGLRVDGLEPEFTRRAGGVLACEPSAPDRVRLASRASPYDSVSMQLGAVAAKLCYSRPSVRGRVVFGSDLVPYDTLWRTGANDPTIIHLSGAVEIAGLKAGPGKYSIYTVPGRTRWTVVVNASTTQGGLTRDEGEFRNEYTAEVRAGEIGRAPVPAEAIERPVERFTIRSEATGPDAAELVLEWERTRVRIPIRKAP